MLGFQSTHSIRDQPMRRLTHQVTHCVGTPPLAIIIKFNQGLSKKGAKFTDFVLACLWGRCPCSRNVFRQFFLIWYTLTIG